MITDINKKDLENKLGGGIDVLEGEESIIGLGILSYKHNAGKLSIYSLDGKKFRGFLKGRD